MLKRLLLVVAALLLVAGTGFTEPLPKIEVAQPVFDFGEVLQGGVVEHTFVFSNSGDAKLVVDRVKSTCGCTGVLLSEKEIPAGGTGTIKAKFNSGNFRGQVEKRILLYSNDPSGAPVHFTVKGTVLLPLEMKPERVIFGAVEVGQTKTITVEVINRSGATFNLAGLQATNPGFRAEIDTNTLAINASTELRVIAVPDATTAHLGGEVLLRSSQPDRTVISLPVSGRVVTATTEGK